MTIAQLDTAIATATQALAFRMLASSHLSGIPAKHNQTAIDTIYDTLNHLHIARFEALEAVR